MERYYVYLLRSSVDGEFYIGQTVNVRERLIRHNSGKVRTTAKRRPLDLLGYVEVNSRREALMSERSLKSHSDKKLAFIRRFIPNFQWRSDRR